METYYIADDTGVILTKHSLDEAEQAYLALTNPAEVDEPVALSYTHLKPVGAIRLLKVIAKQNFKNNKK